MLTRLMMSGTWALLQGTLGFAIAYALTGSAGIALGVALLGGSVGSFAYLLHAQVWAALRR
jgi:uncharacterized membrane protein